ncbi:hypothetical protein OZ668_10860 [Elizabethkingia sp. HX XZB]|uniref:hypothetical protein n=1 Tax=Elizabethkingia sp. HX XZB TaxID=3003193 RepID=UPI002A24C769|nr:hypothetical protein [Elizabethkingia sp. HX XZB]MDX8568491.1 hypothetical protein [Elizabethkingia sp. HX XZB]
MMKKKNESQISDALKKEYVSPVIEVTYVEMEQGVATTSATIISTDINQDIYDQWDTGTDTSGDYDW